MVEKQHFMKASPKGRQAELLAQLLEHSELRLESDWSLYSHSYVPQKATGLNRAREKFKLGSLLNYFS